MDYKQIMQDLPKSEELSEPDEIREEGCDAENQDPSSAGEGRKERSYYYDDAYGYEEYVSTDDDEEAEISDGQS